MKKCKITKEQVIDIAKTLGGVASSGGSIALACGIIRAVLPPGVNVVVQGAMIVGGTILGSFVGDKLTDYVEEQIDQMVEQVDETAKQVKHDLDVIRDKDLIENPEEE